MFDIGIYPHDVDVPTEFPQEPWISETLQKMGWESGRLEINLGSDEWLRAINVEHLQHDYFTDIITFDLSDENELFGELCISLDRAKENSHNLNTSLDQELKRLIIHGALHLKGYNDKTPEEEKEMRQLEEQYL
jgi:rRNA maturation RNase YbeY